MPKQTHGGDDDSEYASGSEEKPKLGKFELGPDRNIRDVFWEIIEKKKEKKEIDEELLKLAYEQRFTFISIVKSIIERKSSKKYGISTAKLLEMIFSLFLNNNWKDAVLGALIEFQEKEWLSEELLKYLKQALNKDQKEKLIEFFKEVIRNPNFYPVGLFYIAYLENKELAMSVKRELKIFAQGDSIENQLRAIEGLRIAGDEESVEVILSLLSNWDVSIRRAAAENLSKVKLTESAVEKIKNHLEKETDEETKKTLRRIVIKWKK
ncbi:MAG: HEAT repeat domain-containing protein [Candidatus Bilamarchaeaceae archaeon]